MSHTRQEAYTLGLTDIWGVGVGGMVTEEEGEGISIDIVRGEPCKNMYFMPCILRIT